MCFGRQKELAAGREDVGDNNDPLAHLLSKRGRSWDMADSGEKVPSTHILSNRDHGRQRECVIR